METPDGRKWYLVCIKWEYRFLSPSTLQTACRRRYERMNGQHSRSTGSLPGLGEARMNGAQDPTTRICKVLPQFATMIHRKGISKGQVFPDKSRLLPQQRSQLTWLFAVWIPCTPQSEGFPPEFSWAPRSPRPRPYLPHPHCPLLPTSGLHLDGSFSVKQSLKRDPFVNF